MRTISGVLRVQGPVSTLIMGSLLNSPVVVSYQDKETWETLYYKF